MESISTYDDTYCAEESGSKSGSRYESDVDLRMEDDVHAPAGIDLDGDVDIEWDGADEDEEDDQEKDEEDEDEEKEEEEDEDENEGKEHRTIGQWVIANISADNVDSIVDDRRILLPAQGQQIREQTPWL